MKGFLGMRRCLAVLALVICAAVLNSLTTVITTERTNSEAQGDGVSHPKGVSRWESSPMAPWIPNSESQRGTSKVSPTGIDAAPSATTKAPKLPTDPDHHHATTSISMTPSTEKQKERLHSPAGAPTAPFNTPPALITEPSSIAVGSDVTSQPPSPSSPFPIPPAPTELPLDVVVAQRIEKEVTSKVYCRERLLLFIGVIVQMVGVNENVGNVYVLPRTNVDEFQKTVSGCDVAFRAPVRLTVVPADKHNLTQQIRETLVHSVVSAWRSTNPEHLGSSIRHGSAEVMVSPIFDLGLRSPPVIALEPPLLSGVVVKKKSSIKFGRGIFGVDPVATVIGNATLTIISRQLAYLGHFYHGWVMPSGHAYIWAIAESAISSMKQLKAEQAALGDLLGAALVTLRQPDVFHTSGAPSVRISVGGVYPLEPPAAEPSQLIWDLYDWTFGGPPGLDRWSNTSLVALSAGPDVYFEHDVDRVINQWLPKTRELLSDRYGEKHSQGVAGAGNGNGREICQGVLHSSTESQESLNTSSLLMGLRILFSPRVRVRDLFRYRGLDPLLEADLLRALNGTVSLARFHYAQLQLGSSQHDRNKTSSPPLQCPPTFTILHPGRSPKEQYQIVQRHKYFFCPEGAFLSWLLFAPDGSVFVTFLEIASDWENFILYHQLHLLGRIGEIKFIFVKIFPGSLPPLESVLSLAFEAAFRPGVFVVSANEVQVLKRNDIERYIAQVNRGGGIDEADKLPGMDANRPMLPFDLVYWMTPATAAAQISPTEHSNTTLPNVASGTPLRRKQVAVQLRYGVGGRVQITGFQHPLVTLDACKFTVQQLDAARNGSASPLSSSQSASCGHLVEHLDDTITQPPPSLPSVVDRYRREWILEKVSWPDPTPDAPNRIRSSWKIRFAVRAWAMGMKASESQHRISECGTKNCSVTDVPQQPANGQYSLMLCRRNRVSEVIAAPNSTDAIAMWFADLVLQQEEPSTLWIDPSVLVEGGRQERPGKLAQDGGPFHSVQVHPSRLHDKKATNHDGNCLWDFLPIGGSMTPMKGRKAVLKLMPTDWSSGSAGKRKRFLERITGPEGTPELVAPLRKEQIVDDLGQKLLTKTFGLTHCPTSWRKTTELELLNLNVSDTLRGQERADDPAPLSKGKEQVAAPTNQALVLLTHKSYLQCAEVKLSQGNSPAAEQAGLPAPLVVEFIPVLFLPGVYHLRPVSSTSEPPAPKTKPTRRGKFAEQGTPRRTGWVSPLRILSNPQEVAKELAKISDDAPWDVRVSPKEFMSLGVRFPTADVWLRGCTFRSWQCMWVCRTRGMRGEELVGNETVHDPSSSSWARIAGDPSADEETIKFKRLNRRVTLCELELFSHPSTVVVMNPADKTMRLASRFPLSEEGQAPLPTLPIQPTDEIVVLAVVL